MKKIMTDEIKLLRWPQLLTQIANQAGVEALKDLLDDAQAK